MASSSNPLVGRFDKQTLPVVENLLTAACRRMRTLLINRVGFDVPVSVTHQEFGQFGPIQNQIREAGTCLIARFRLKPVGLPALMAIEGPLLFRLFGLLLGEDPWAEPTPMDDRPLTDTDKRMAKRLVEDLLMGLEESLPPEAGQHLILEEISSNPRVHLGLPDSTGMIDSYLQFGDAESLMGTARIILPTHVVPALFARHIREPDRGEEGIGRIMPLNVDVIAELARVKMPLTRLNTLDVGSMIDIGQVRNIEVRVAGKAALIAQPGSRDGNRCIRIVRKLHDAPT